MGGVRWNKCAICGTWRPVRPLYERTYEDSRKSGRFVRAAWTCDECLKALKAGEVVRKVPVLVRLKP